MVMYNDAGHAFLSHLLRVCKGRVITLRPGMPGWRYLYHSVFIPKKKKKKKEKEISSFSKDCLTGERHLTDHTGKKRHKSYFIKKTRPFVGNNSFMTTGNIKLHVEENKFVMEKHEVLFPSDLIGIS